MQKDRAVQRIRYFPLTSDWIYSSPPYKEWRGGAVSDKVMKAAGNMFVWLIDATADPIQSYSKDVIDVLFFEIEIDEQGDVLPHARMRSEYTCTNMYPIYKAVKMAASATFDENGMPKAVSIHAIGARKQPCEPHEWEVIQEGSYNIRGSWLGNEKERMKKED